MGARHHAPDAESRAGGDRRGRSEQRRPAWVYISRFFQKAQLPDYTADHPGAAHIWLSPRTQRSGMRWYKSSRQPKAQLSATTAREAEPAYTRAAALAPTDAERQFLARGGRGSRQRM